MAYAWQTKIQSGSVVDDSFYISIQDTYNEVMNNHCPSNYTSYNKTNRTNKSDKISVTACASNYTGNDAGDDESYSCTSNYSTDYSTNKSSNYSTNKSSNYSSNLTSDNGHDGGDK